MKVASTRYIFPPRPTTAVPREATRSYAKYGWLAQLKYNDARCLIKCLPSPTTSANDIPIELWGRHGEKFRNYTAPDWLLEQLRETHQKLGLNPAEWSLLDGGLLDFKHEAIRDTITIWDILVKDGEHLTGTTYEERYQQLKNAARAGDWYYEPPHRKHEAIKFGTTIVGNIFIPDMIPPADWDATWDMIDKINAPYFEVGKGPVVEGLVFKDPTGILENGWKEQNNTDWSGRSRVQTGRHRF